MSNQIEIIQPSNEMKKGNLIDLVAAEIDAQISTAKKYPRSIRAFIDNATAMVTLNEKIADSCNYALPRSGKIIEGASARFAELIFSAWGNSRAGARVVHNDGKFVTAQGICHDLESNTMITFEVKRRITDKNGKMFNDDMITVTGNAAASIALRNAILKVIPKAFWEPLYEESRRVAMGDSKTIATRRADALAVMQKFGVTQEMILRKLNLKGIEDITIEHLATLNACRNSIKAGDATAEELFAVEQPKAKNNDDGKSKLDAFAEKLDEAEEVRKDAFVKINELISRLKKVPEEDRAGLFVSENGQDLFEKSGSLESIAKILSELGISVIVEG